MTKSNDEDVWILIQICFREKFGYFVFSLKKINWGEWGKFLVHGLFLQAPEYFFSLLNIFCLTGFVTAAKQDHKLAISHSKIDSVTFSYKDSHFTDCAANRFYITEISGFSPQQSHCNSFSCLTIFDFGKPLLKCLCRYDFIAHWDFYSLCAKDLKNESFVTV